MRSYLSILFAGGILLLQPAQARADVSGGLAGYWRFNNNGDDSSGFGRDLNLIGGVGFTTGLFGQALDLHKNPQQYAVRPVDDNVFDFGASDFTIQVWVNFYDSSNFNQVLIEKFVGAAGAGWTFEEDGTQQWLFHTDPTFRDIYSSPQPIPEHVWHHVVSRVGIDAGRTPEWVAVFIEPAGVDVGLSSGQTGALPDNHIAAVDWIDGYHLVLERSCGVGCDFNLWP